MELELEGWGSQETVRQKTVEIVSHNCQAEWKVITQHNRLGRHFNYLTIYTKLRQIIGQSGANNSQYRHRLETRDYTVTVFLKDSASVTFPPSSLLPTCYFLLSLTSVVKFYISAFNV